MEKPPRKKKGSNLRVSLGRKSVGDLTALEVSHASSNESCHLNPDSAVIDPDLAANPDWFKHLGPNCSVLASQDSVNEAILNERDANLVNNSDIEGLNLSTFDRRQINQILNSSVVVNRSEIERLTKRKSQVQSQEVDAELSEDDDIFPPKKPRRPTTFKRGTPKDGGKSLVADKAFQAIADHDSESDEETVPPVKTSKTKSARKPSLFPDSEVSVEIKRKRPQFLQKRKKGTVTNDDADVALHNVFKSVMDETTDSESGADTSKAVVPPTTDKSKRDNSPTKDISIEIPRRRPNFLRKSFKKDKRTSQDIYDAFKEVADQTSDYLEDSAAVDTVPQEPVEQVVGTSHRRSVAAPAIPQSPKDSDVSLEIRRRRPAFLMKKSKNDFNPSQDLIDKFQNIMEHSTDSEGGHVSKQVMSADSTNRSNRSKPPGDDDVSIEIPQRRPAFLKKGFKSTRTSLDAYNAFFNVTSGSEEDEASKENLPSVNHTPEADTSLPLGAEANNISGIPEVFQTMKKQSLSLKKLHSGNQVDLLSQVVEENTILDSQPLNRSNSRLMVPDHGHASIGSVTEHTRSAPIRVSHFSQHEHPSHEEIGVSPSGKESSILGARKLPSLGNAEQPNISSGLGRSMRSIGPSPVASKEQASLKSIMSSSRNESLPQVQDVINSPLSSKETSTSQRVKRSLQGNSVKDVTSHKISMAQRSGSESDGVDSTFSNATTISLPSNLTSNLPGMPSQSARRVSESTSRSAARTETAHSSVPSKQTLMSNSISKPLQSQAYSESPAMSFLNDTGSDSVFSSGNSKARRSSLVKENSNDSSWPENPFVSVISRTESSGEEAEPFEEELSSIEAVNHVEDNGEEHGSFTSSNENRSNNQEKTQRNESYVLPSGSSQPRAKSVSPVRGSPTRNHANRHSIFSPPSDKTSPVKAVRHQTPVVTTAGSSKTNSMKTQKVHDEDYLERMRAAMSKWTEEVHSGMHISKPLTTKPAPIVFKKPIPKSVPKQTKKKVVCSYLADYRPPKRVKPKPYVTSKMYKFIEGKLQPKFGLESRIKAEEFVEFLCRTVSNVISKMSKYHQLVFDLRDEMVSLGLIKTQLQYHVFIEEYLPDSFRVKSIPCYGCPKGPKLDVDDLNKDLSVK